MGSNLRRWTFWALTLAAGGLACAGQPAWPAVRSPGPDCIDPCAAMTCPGGTHCAWDGQCHPRCDTDSAPNGWKP